MAMLTFVLAEIPDLPLSKGLLQTWSQVPDSETILVVAQGSCDRAEEIARSLPGIRLVECPGRERPSLARLRQAGAGQATTPWTAFVDHRSRPGPGFSGRLAPLLEQPAVLIAGSPQGRCAALIFPTADYRTAGGVDGLDLCLRLGARGLEIRSLPLDCLLDEVPHPRAAGTGLEPREARSLGGRLRSEVRRAAAFLAGAFQARTAPPGPRSRGRQGDAEAERPVFLLGTGGRTGSTLLQRLIISTRGVMLWGEHNGHLLAAVENWVHDMQAWHDQSGGAQYQRFLRKGCHTFIPNVTPPMEWFQRGARAAFRESLGGPAARLGFPRWGFKEIRYGGPAALTLAALFPGAQFVVITRNPADALRSIKSTPWYGPDYGADPARFLAEWEASASSLLDALPRLGPGLLVRHEELLEAQEACLAALARHLHLDPARFDRSLFGTVHRGSSTPPRELEQEDFAALAHPAIQRTAARLGYTLPQ